MKRQLSQSLGLLLAFLLLLTGCAQETPEDIPASSQDLTSVDSPANGTLTVSYIDVGQGDSTFIEFPDGKTMLIDGGETEYGQTVIDYIESRGASSIDYLVATHPHSDHIGGLPAVIGAFGIGEVYMPKAQSTTKIYETLLTAVSEKGLSIHTAKAGVSVCSGNQFSVDFLAPCGDSYSDLNNYSAVTRIVWGDTSFLFMGDAEALSEKEILSGKNADTLRSDVLKAGHHGSAYSSSEAFLSAVSPEYAVISCGAGNKYGHPEQTALDRLSDAGAQVFRTDRQGTIIFESDGTRIAVDKKAAPLKENAPSDETEPPRQTPAEPIKQEVTVYITKTGNKYHSAGCQYLRQSKISISLDEAKASCEPCPKCNPPQ